MPFKANHWATVLTSSHLISGGSLVVFGPLWDTVHCKRNSEGDNNSARWAYAQRIRRQLLSTSHTRNKECRGFPSGSYGLLSHWVLSWLTVPDMNSLMCSGPHMQWKSCPTIVTSLFHLQEHLASGTIAGGEHSRAGLAVTALLQQPT